MILIVWSMVYGIYGDCDMMMYDMIIFQYSTLVFNLLTLIFVILWLSLSSASQIIWIF